MRELIHRPSAKTTVVLCLVLCVFLFLCAVKLRSYVTADSDEGVYLATFRALHTGFPLYHPTYSSQPPGFFLTAYPVYLLLGRNLQAARLAVYLCSLAGLPAVVWFARELKSTPFGFVTIGVLYSLPLYYEQAMTFHPDILPTAFSVLALAAILRYRHTSSRAWLSLSALAAGLSVLTKADVTVLPAIFGVMVWAMLEKKEPLRRLVAHAALFAVVLAAGVVALTLPFGLDAVFKDVITLRLQAAAAFPLDAGVLYKNLTQMPQLVWTLILGLLLSGIAVFIDPTARPPVVVLLLWILCALTILAVYHPLFAHHLTPLTMPIALLFSLAAFKILNRLNARLARGATLVFVAAVMLGRLGYALATPEGIVTEMDQHAVDLIQANTQAGDYVVSDNGLIPVLAGRPVPPELTDLSYVRIKAGNLTPQAFEAALVQYRPRMVLTWANKLLFMPDFEAILQRHHYTLLETVEDACLCYQHQAYMLESQ